VNALEPEQLGFEQLGRERRAVHLDEGLVASEGGRAQGPRHEFLAGSAFAANEHGEVGIRDPFDQFPDLGHPFAMAEQHRAIRLGLELLPQRRDLTDQFMLPQRVGERQLEVGFVEGLADEVGSAKLHRLDHRRRAALPGEDDDRDVAIDLLEGGQRFEPVHPAGHHDVEDDRRGPTGLIPTDRFFSVADGDRRIPPLGKKVAEECAH
jgi:hypothetical protein